MTQAWQQQVVLALQGDQVVVKVEKAMTILVVGATGATGRLLVEQLLSRGYSVRVVVRSPEKLSDAVKNHPSLTMTEASILDLTDAKLTEVVHGCAAVASCLGHTLNWNGIFGYPHRLVTDATRRLCMAIQANKGAAPTKLVLMNSVAVRNRDLCEPLPLADRCVIGLVRLLLPPHADNEQAADFLRTGIGQHDRAIEWVAVRPDSLTDDDTVSEYAAYPSPIRSGVFNPGSTSRINVAHFMAELITSEQTWNQWKGQMPVIYNVIP